MAGFTVITAKYAGRCSTCKKAFAAGEQIAYNRVGYVGLEFIHGVTRHVACARPATDPERIEKARRLHEVACAAGDVNTETYDDFQLAEAVEAGYRVIGGGWGGTFEKLATEEQVDKILSAEDEAERIAAYRRFFVE